MTEQLELGLHLAPLIHPGRKATIQETFESFHATNPWVYEALVTLARQHRRSGSGRRAGIGMLFEVLRWQYDMRVETAGSPWRLDNNLRSRYARLIAEREPDLRDCFELRGLRAA
jgi:DNA-directed RNA polymerase specialized sigma24 family protein